MGIPKRSCGQIFNLPPLSEVVPCCQLVLRQKEEKFIIVMLTGIEEFSSGHAKWQIEVAS